MNITQTNQIHSQTKTKLKIKIKLQHKFKKSTLFFSAQIGYLYTEIHTLYI
uniref:Uncharacterized protein n=1 Tax=Anguilla anguilla TaxID=7936 RepID=A0A0E9WNX5_ANGAN